MDIHRPDLKRRAQRRRLIYLAVAAAAVLLAGWAVASLEPAAPGVARSSLWLDTVKRGDMLREVRGPGTLVPREIRWIAAETNARRSEEHTSELQSLMRISYAVFCLKKKKKQPHQIKTNNKRSDIHKTHTPYLPHQQKP